MRIDWNEFRGALEGIGAGLLVTVIVLVVLWLGHVIAGGVGAVLGVVAIVVASPFLVSVRRR